MVERIHRTAREAERPDLGARIAEHKAALDWSRRGIASVRGLLLNILPDATVLEHWARTGVPEATKRRTLSALGFSSSAVSGAIAQARRTPHRAASRPD